MTCHILIADPTDLSIADLQAVLLTGTPVVVSMRPASGQAHLIDWARANGRFVRIDRASDWGNPFVIGRDGNRDAVIRAHAEALADRGDLLARLRNGELAAKVLGCWCAPQRCHGHTLAALTLDSDFAPIDALQELAAV
ncbi:DUF4326 domain-containing protein (plasmid) [Nocardia sp. NBC_01377]|uniref:DUF4326 domain-containing protein n=1 Tax=Nocardia sp. NBC_01377 TaxID=2903595 RepID=UPI002F914896